jgi:aryl-alcohol dehydrogenase-like predicted oxidoreductase
MITPLPQRLLGKTGLSVSIIGLGTAEIGLIYGVGKTTLPSEQEAFAVLGAALDLGVTYFDTGRGYGVAEERIGKLGLATKPGILVGTKCAQFLETGEDARGSDLEKRIRADIEESLRALRVDVLPLVQLHFGTKEQIERGEIIEILQKLKDEQKVLHVGISTRGEPAGLAAVNSGFFETVQIAYSIVDQRMAPSVMPLAEQKNVGVINRSVFLKGTLTPAADKLPSALSPLRDASARARKIAESEGLSLPELALRFVLSQKVVSTALVGTANPKNIESAVAAAAAGPLSENIMAALSALAIDDPMQVDPAKWPKL